MIFPEMPLAGWVETKGVASVSFPLPGLSVAAFVERLHDALASVGIDPQIRRPVPFDLPDAVPFAEDTTHSTYDPAAVTRYRQVLGQVALLLEDFAGRSYVKTSPVNHFWRTFDLALTRVSDRQVAQGRVSTRSPGRRTPTT